MHLPRDRKGLYDAALELLLVRWDEVAGSGRTQARAGHGGAGSDPATAGVLASRTRTSCCPGPRRPPDRARDAGDPAAPRRPRGRAAAHPGTHRAAARGVDGQIQFVHRTFRDYLAAKEVVDSGDLGLLIDHAHLDQWHDVVIMAVAHARPGERELILTDLLRGNTAARERRPCTTGCDWSPRPAWPRPT